MLRENEKITIKPFLRWAGGKSLFVNEIIARFPIVDKTTVYFEPFLGAGSVFLSLKPQKAVLSDLNEQLIYSFTAIRDRADAVYRYLMEMAAKDSERFYYKTREEYNRSGFSLRQAARFIYLNKADLTPNSRTPD